MSPSRCIYASGVELSIGWMHNTGEVNEGVIAVRVAPSVAPLSNMSFSSLAQLSVLGQSLQIKEWEYSAGLLQLFFAYNFTLEG